MASGKRRGDPVKVVPALPYAGGGPDLLAQERPRPARKQRGRARRPPPLLTWLQPEGVGEPGVGPCRKQPAIEVQREVEQCVQMVTSVWGGTPRRGGEAGGAGARGLRSQRRRVAPQAAPSCSDSERGGSRDEQDSGSAVLQARSSSATGSDGGGAQEALSSSTVGSTSTDSRALLSRGAHASEASGARGPQDERGSVAAGPLSPGTIYAHQLTLVKQAIQEGPARPPGSGPPSLEGYIAAKLDAMCRELPQEEAKQPAMAAGEEEAAASPRFKIEEGCLEGGTGGGSLGSPPPCGDHSQELLERIVAEVRKVVRGAAPLKGSILEQIAEAAYSNKGVAVSPCEACGVAASADMAHILSVSLGHTLEGSELRIGHAAVALLNARLNGASGGLASFGLQAGPEGGPSTLLMLLASDALPALDLPSSSDCSWPAGVSRNGSPASFLGAFEHTSLAVPSASDSRPLFPAPAPRFTGDAEQHSLLPPLPTFTSTMTSEQAGRVSPSEGASGLPFATPPAWHHDLPKGTGAFYGCDSTLHLLDAIKDSSAWEAAIPHAPGSSPLLHDDPAYHSLPASLPGLTAYPMPHGGMSVLLTSKARAGEAALVAGQLPGEAPKGAADSEAVPKESGKRGPGLMEDLFGGEGPAPERQLSADELAIQSYLADDHTELCTAAADAFPVGLAAVDDELDLEDPLAAPHGQDWDGFLGGDLTAPCLTSGWSQAPEAGSAHNCPMHEMSWNGQAAASVDALAQSASTGRESAGGAACLEVGEGKVEAAQGDRKSGQPEDGAEHGPASHRGEAEAQGLAARDQSVLACESSPLVGEPVPCPMEGHPGGPQQSQKVRSLTELYQVDGHASLCQGGAEEGRKRSKRCAGGVARRQRGGATCTQRGSEEANAIHHHSEVIDLRNA
ncbi:hypothetical protein KFL_005400030 [Klebsormidium nitens]|uniref:Uncharacterized protein n=1 Tax=Klebsormidium nitens TaxID=105231 RepID=A0A1Y1IG27_KLENI|nr:hypothetical protein KFL_005400030 [Klebsormidium nitens]|eukprot:GAQ89593.1 hypothetical protein KFL_005400030 [Klebsormidium nitens]